MSAGFDVAVGADAAATSGGGSDSGQSAQESVSISTGGGRRGRPSDFLDRSDTWNSDTLIDATRASTKDDIDPSRIEKKLGGEQLQDPEADPDAQIDADAEQQEQQGDPNDPRVAFKPYFDALSESISTGKPLDMKMFGDAPVVAKYNGKEITIPLKEALSSYQRQIDTTNKNKEIARIRDRAQHILALEQARSQQWQDHNALRRDLRAMGLGNTLDRLVMAEAEERVAFKRLPQHEQQRIIMQRELEARQQQWEAERQQLMRQMQQQNGSQMDQVTQHFTAVLEQTLPAAFAAEGIHDYPFSRRVFLENLMAEFDGASEFTDEHVRAAARATKQYLDDHAPNQGGARPAQAAQQQNTRPGGHAGVNQALPPRRMSGNVGGNVRPFNPNNRSRPSDFAGKYNL